jgi:hypothetical protein
MKKIWIVLPASLLILSACTPAQSGTGAVPSVETIVAATFQAMTPAAPPTAQPTAALPTTQSAATLPTATTMLTAQPTAAQSSGIPVSYNNVTFSIPLELNASASPTTNTDVEFPYINPSGGPMAEHVVFQITNYPVQGDAKIIVFKSSDFAAYGVPSQDAITALLKGQETIQPISKALIQGNFYAQAKPVTFKNGHGVRYLTEVLTGFAPITNQDLFYYYEGVTNDGAYFVSAIFHVTAPFLVVDGNQNSSTPPDGVPFNWGANLDFPKYLNDITQKLNNTTPENYTVPLTVLDQLIGTVHVNP